MLGNDLAAGRSGVHEIGSAPVAAEGGRWEDVGRHRGRRPSVARPGHHTAGEDPARAERGQRDQPHARPRRASPRGARRVPARHLGGLRHPLAHHRGVRGDRPRTARGPLHVRRASSRHPPAPLRSRRGSGSGESYTVSASSPARVRCRVRWPGTRRTCAVNAHGLIETTRRLTESGAVMLVLPENMVTPNTVSVALTAVPPKSG